MRSLRARIAWLVLAGLALGCERGRAIGQPCDSADRCESGVCTLGLGYSDAICTQRCRGEGRGTCPQGWSCSGHARKLASPNKAEVPSICVPETAAAPVAGAPEQSATRRFDNQP